MVQEVDHVTWRADVSFECYGARIRLRCNRAELWDRIERRLPPNAVAVPSCAVDHTFSLWIAPEEELSENRSSCVIYCGASAIAHVADLDEALDHLESAVHFWNRHSLKRSFCLHAGVVGWNGHAIVIPGRSLSGKTTLVETLVRQGATYYSDEYAVLDRAGRIHPYIKSLSIRRPGQRNQRLDPTKLGNIGSSSLFRWGRSFLRGYSRGAEWNPQGAFAQPTACSLFWTTQ